MRVFLAGASGVIGRSLIGLLLGAGHEVTGMTRPAARAEEIRARGAQAAVADALDAQALTEAVVAARPEGVIHQLTALPPRIHPRRYGQALAPTNVLRRERTRDLESQVLEHGTSGVYDIVDDEPAPACDWVPVYAASVGAKPPRSLPAWLARLVGGPAGVAVMTTQRGANNAKAKRELGWTLRYSSWRDGFRAGAT